MQNPSEGPQVCCIVVNWNGWEDTSQCLAALERQTYRNLSVIVVDNGSVDGSSEKIATRYAEVVVVQADSNLGFPKACNLGALQPLARKADFLWFLNNDTVPSPETAASLVAALKQNDRIGIVGSVLYYLQNPQQIQAWGGGTINLWTGYNRHFRGASRLNDRSYLTFASVLVRRSTFEQLGGLSEAAFMYFEDTDFSFRARASGWQLVVAPETRILHKEGGSSRSRSPVVDRMVTTAGLIFLTQHAPVPAVARLLYAGSRIARRLLRRDWEGVKGVLGGLSDWRLAHNRVDANTR